MEILNFLFFIIVQYLYFQITEAQFEDTRCRCTCPEPASVGAINETQRNIYIKSVERKDCNCEQVVLSELSLAAPLRCEYCAKCQCKHQSRNTTTIKVVVFITIVSVASLVIYLIWLKVLQRLFGGRFVNNFTGANLSLAAVHAAAKRATSPTIIPQNNYFSHNDRDDLIIDDDNIFAENDSRNTFQGPIIDGRPAETRLRRASEAVLSKVEQQQNRWFAKVHEQRKKIFTDHTMLN